MSIQESLELALQHHQQNRLAEAEAIYRQVISQHPDQSDALHLLGVLAAQTGRAEWGVELIGKAIAICPSAALYHLSLGTAFETLGKRDEMIASNRRALEIDPASAEAKYNLANGLFRNGQSAEAIRLYRELLAANPKFAQAWNNLGNAHNSLGEYDQAMKCFGRALEVEENFAHARFNLGNVHMNQGRLPEAIVEFRKAIAAQPDFAEAYDNLGVALKRRGELDHAIEAHRGAVAANPQFAQGYCNLGAVLGERGFLKASMEALNKAISLRPNYGKAYNNLANALKNAGLFDDAFIPLQWAMNLMPTDAAAHSAFIHAMLYRPDIGAEQIHREEKRWNVLHAKPLEHLIRPHENDRTTNRRLKIGYVSADFLDHIAGLNLLPLMRNHDHEAFEVFCYSNSRETDPQTEHFKSACDVWRVITNIDDESAAKLIREDGIDILMDLSLHTAGNRLPLFGCKPAPVQATFIGYPGSTGVSTVDYRLTDWYLDPIGGGDRFYSEESIRLADSFWCYDPVAMQVSDYPISPLPALSAGVVTFGSFNNISKLNDSVLELWAKVMRSVAGSRLIIAQVSEWTRPRILQKLQEEGIDPSRVDCVARMKRAEYFGSFERIDICLDTFPYNGHTTSLDSFWMGVPCVTLIGSTVVGRAGFSQLCNLGLKEFAASTPDEFVRIASELAGDLPRLAEIRTGLRERMRSSPLCDGVRFARNVESAYRQMWRRWCEKKDV